MFTYERASVFTKLLEAIISYEAVKNARQHQPEDKNLVRIYGERRATVEFWVRQLLTDGYEVKSDG